MFCRSCGSELMEEWLSCPICGIAVGEIEIVKRESSDQPNPNVICLGVDAGELTLSGQCRFTTEVELEGKSVTVKNYMSTKSFSEPIINKFMLQDIMQIENKRCLVLRKRHKISLVMCIGIILLGLLVSESYFVVVGLFIIAFQCFHGSEKTMVLHLKSQKRIKIYYRDIEDANVIKQYLQQRC